MRFTPKSLLCSALLLVTGFTCYFVGKRNADKWWKVHTYVGETQRISWPTVMREGRTNEEIIEYLHTRFPEPKMNDTGFSCPDSYSYTSLYFQGDRDDRGVEVGALYIGTCLPEKKQGWVFGDEDMPEQTQPYNPSVKEPQ